MRSLPWLLFVLLPAGVFGQDPLWSAGARFRGMGDASAAIRDGSAWSPNPGSPEATAGIRHGFTVGQPFQLEGAATASAGILVPLHGWTGSAGVYHFGDAFHSRSSLMMGSSTEAGNTSAGIRMEYHQVRTEGFPTQGMLSWSAGSITAIGKKISVGAFAGGMARYAIGNTVQRIVPHFIAGIAVRPSAAVLLAVDVHKRPDRAPGLRVGLEYQVMRNAYARMGMGLQPETVAAGAGFRIWRMTIDQAIRYSAGTGWSAQATVGYLMDPHK